MKLFALPAALAAVLAFTSLAETAPIINGTVYEETNDQDCSSTDHCNLTFTLVPAGRTLTVNSVSCLVLKSTSQFVFSLSVGQLVGPPPVVKRPRFLTPVQLGIGSALETYQSNDEVELVLKANTRPAVSVNAFGHTGSISLQCTIIGKLSQS